MLHKFNGIMIWKAYTVQEMDRTFLHKKVLKNMKLILNICWGQAGVFFKISIVGINISKHVLL